jgi:FRG domain
MVFLKNWEQFNTEYEKLVDYCEKKRQQNHPLLVSRPLFRGQANAQWRLNTTLERYTQSEACALKDYYRHIHSTKAEIETYTGREWRIPSPTRYDTWLDKQGDSRSSLHGPPAYDYMVYLRHHGFPSPLLDWSRSPYIAAFFAFNNASPKHAGEAEYVSIYAFLDQTAEFNPVGIIHQGSNVRSHKRHFVQPPPE